MFRFEEVITVEMCKQHPNAIFVFGDNLLQRGKAGQAVIRECSNAFGIPTKRVPSMNKDAFFSDTIDEYAIVKQKLIYLWNNHIEGKEIVLPANKIGSGLAKLKVYSPKIEALIDRFYISAMTTTEI